MSLEFVATETPVFDPGVYSAQLEAIDERTSKTASLFGGDGTYYSWKFQILDPEHDGEYLYANSSTSFGKKAKARKWAKGILGREIATGEHLMADDLLGLPCQLVLDVETDNEGDPRNTITQIMPAQSAQQSKNGKAPAGATTPTLGELFEDNTEGATQAGLIRRYEQAKKTLGWKPEAFAIRCKQIIGWTAEAIAERPGPVNFAKLAIEAQRRVVEDLEAAAQQPDAYDEDGDLKFS